MRITVHKTSAVGLLACCLCGLLGGSSHAEEQAALFEEKFPSAQLNASWTRAFSGASKVDLKDGWATFDGPLHGRTHIERPAGQDHLMLSATMARWGAIYVVWDENNWCGVGKVAPTPFGRFYSIDVEGGKATDVDHRNVDFNAPHRVRIQLGSDYVRFQYAQGPRYITLRTIERPAGWTGAPKLIATGLPYGAEDRPFGGSEAANQALGPKVNGAVRDLRVRATPEAELKLSQAELALVRKPPVEPVQALLQGEDDPTYEQMVGFYPPFQSPREVLGVPAHALDIGVDHLGRLDVSPWGPPIAWFEIGGDSGAYFTWDRSSGVMVPPPKSNDIKRRLEKGYLPILHLSTAVDGLDREITVFGWSEGFAADKDLYAYVRLTAGAADQAKRPKQFSIVWGDGDKRREFKAAENGETAACCLRFKYPKPDTATEITPEEFEARRQEVASFWTPRLAKATRFDIPDTRVMEAYRAWLLYSQLNSDTINGYVEPHDGAGFYEEMFGNSVSLHSAAMDMYGLHDWVEKVLDTQIHYQQPDGLYTQACGLVDPGGFLFGLARHYQMTRDKKWLRRVAPSIVKQCAWLVRQRADAPKDDMVKGLIKFRPYNDYQDPVYNYLGNVWCATGMRLAGEVLKEIDAPEAAELEAEAARYRQDILDSMDAAAIQRDGQTILPMEPDTHRLLKMSKYRSGDYYGLVASPLLATGFLAPDDKRATWIVDALEKRGAILAGVCEFECGIDHAYTYGYLMNALQRGEVRKTLLGFWSFMAFGMTHDTYSPVEVTMMATGENHYTLPHLYSCTEQLRLLRGLLLREDGDALCIGEGIPRAWLQAGKRIAVDAAPTQFGPLSYRIEPQADGSMRVHIDPPTRQVPAEVRVHLRHPGRLKIARVAATSETKLRHAGETITLSGVKTPVDLQVTFK